MSISTFLLIILQFGIAQRGTYDGYPVITQCPITPLTSMSYTFRADPQGTTFWHAHYHEENEDGLYGPFIVEDRPNSFPFHYDQDIVIMMTDAYNLLHINWLPYT